MNRNQQIAVAVGAVVVLLMMIFPPFHVQIRGTTFNMGYRFILDPPRSGNITASVNVGMLLVQWVGALLLTALAFLALKLANAKSGHMKPLIAATPHPVPDSLQHEDTFGGQHQSWRRFYARTENARAVILLMFSAMAVYWLISSIFLFLFSVFGIEVVANIQRALPTVFGAPFVFLPAYAIALSKHIDYNKVGCLQKLKSTTKIQATMFLIFTIAIVLSLFFLSLGLSIIFSLFIMTATSQVAYRLK